MVNNKVFFMFFDQIILKIGIDIQKNCYSAQVWRSFMSSKSAY